ncbi:TolC family protein [Bacteroidetes/Chlorobi group bacterium ChocPot_Mid]|nr:MAG: TolC family protein [Bacteroidetes/Chlorobi group bacterium ChocPot_Mid]
MRILIFVSLTWLCLLPLKAELTIDNCQKKAYENYPLVRQYDLLEKSKSYNISNANKLYLPQISVSGRATYQSDVVEIPFKFPLFTFDEISKDQYQVVGEINQIVWDGGAVSGQKNIINATSEIEKNKLSVELYNLKDRINQLFFGILLIRESIKRNEQLILELEKNLERVTSLWENGVVSEADVNSLKVEIINANQRKTELKGNEKSYRKMLSILIGEDIDDNQILIVPSTTEDSNEFKNSNLNNLLTKRPEIELFQAQENLFSHQTENLNNGRYPKIGLFFQAGYGRPGFNLLKNDFSFYYIGGIRLSWNLSSFYNVYNNEELLIINKKSIEVQKENFLFNNNIKYNQYKVEIEKYNELLKNDDEIISLRYKIKQSSEARLENGTISITDLIHDINAENLAKLDKTIHEIQLLLSIYNYKFLVNE